MESDRVARLSLRMAAVTLGFIVTMMLLNAACWVYPSLGAVKAGAGLAFGLTYSLMSNLNVDISTFPWWQKTGGIVLSSVPFVPLANGLRHLRLLFRIYARQEYFSARAAHHFGKVGSSLGVWVMLSLLCEPLLSVWATMCEPVGQRLITFSFGVPYVVALFTAACIAVIALILRRASELDAEHRQIV
ncbi:DUF2975 domain-containing protein [Burkholderia sp. Nafp2/4-1b]|uniref:DUF2975 domain-containing protein n=1 Tax=Burkholderia sp. Nafp2/4-1b TaxID=2116686 RepID=UPI000EF8FA42|nr:DUF2975 domain-containing protein [Burkholderia sp. Nafp2/4-1b]RKT98995.1 DUF2975 domain-containing protein [Burkholderia sp. Nafp2/4-1b]